MKINEIRKSNLAAYRVLNPAVPYWKWMCEGLGWRSPSFLMSLKMDMTVCVQVDSVFEMLSETVFVASTSFINRSTLHRLGAACKRVDGQ